MESLLGFVIVMFVLLASAYVGWSGLMWVFRPSQWATSSWSLCPEQYRHEFARLGFRLKMRFVGAVMTMGALALSLPALSALAKGFGVPLSLDPMWLARAFSGTFRWGLIVLSLSQGALYLLAPEKLAESEWSTIPAYVHDRMGNKSYRLFVRFLGVFWLVTAYLLVNPLWTWGQ
jgi:hypothetical protein